MDINKMLADLRAEQATIEEVMIVLARLGSNEKRRGRPPKWLTAQAPEAAAKKRGRPKGSKNKPRSEAVEG